jgi:long-subunit fatty acid transport protein
MAYIFGQDGLISFDYAYRDFSNIQFKSSNDLLFSEVNNTIETSLKGVSTFKVGGEYRIDKLSLRGGFNYEDSPFKDSNILGDRTGFTTGLGYNFGNYSLDVAYSRAEQSRNQQLYTVGLTDAASIDTTYDSFLLTFGLSL